MNTIGAPSLPVIVFAEPAIVRGLAATVPPVVDSCFTDGFSCVVVEGCWTTEDGLLTSVLALGDCTVGWCCASSLIQGEGPCEKTTK